MQFKESVEVKLKVKFKLFEPTMSQQQVFNNLLLSIQNKFIVTVSLSEPNGQKNTTLAPPTAEPDNSGIT
jgi:hypothetical protein